VLGRALKDERREGIEVFTKVFWPMGEGRNDRGLSRKHLMEGIDASLRRLQMDYVDLYQAHRYDVETPLEETMNAFSDIVRAGKALYVGVSEWTAEQIREAKAIADDLGLGFVSNQPQYFALWRVIEGEVVPTCEALGIGQVVWSPIGRWSADRQVRARFGSPDRLPGGQRRQRDDALPARRRSRARSTAGAARQGGRPVDGRPRGRLGVAEPQRVQRDCRRSRPEQVADNVKAAGVRLDADLLAKIDEALLPVAVTDPAETANNAPRKRP
jgi:aryl-alcohol dehydrogenase-like predicted oxidoreductase